MRPLTLILLSICFGSPFAVAEAVIIDLSIQKNEHIWHQARAAEVTYLNGEAPSCSVFAARLEFKQKQQQQLELLLKNINASARPATTSQIQELMHLQSRIIKLEEELQQQVVRLEESVPLSQIPEILQPELIGQRYEIMIQSPGLTWVSSSGHAPFDFSFGVSNDSLQIQTDWHLLNYCFSNRRITVRLTL